jgi:soluble cytochrome b562
MLAIAFETRNLKQLTRYLIQTMKFKSLLSLAAVLALGFNVALAADDDTPLAKEMKTTNKSIRTLKRQLDDASKKDDNLALIATAKKSVEASSKLEPAKTKDVPAGEKAAYLDKYHAEMKEVAKAFDDLEAAVKDGKTDDAKKILEKLADQKEKGHKDFNPDDK